MGWIGWPGLTFGVALIHDWSKKHCSDPELESAAWREMYETIESANDVDGDRVDEGNFEISETPLQRQWLQQESFSMMCATPWFLGLTHGVGTGGLLGGLLALIPGAWFSVTTGAFLASVGGALTLAWIMAAVLALVPKHKDDPSPPWTGRQRLILLVSPLLAVPALIEAATLWGRWLIERRPEAT